MKSQLYLIEMVEESKWNPLFINTPAVLGRNASADVIIDKESVSSEHARIVLENDQYMCADMGSTNGTRINNSKITREIISDGDILALGKISYLVKIVHNSFPCLYLVEEKRTAAIALDTFMIGRSPQNQLIILDGSVSTRHAKITCEGEKYFIEDDKSTNGTRVNGQRIRKTEIHDCDKIQFGQIESIFLEKAMDKENEYSIRHLSEGKSEVKKIGSKINIGSGSDNHFILEDSLVNPHHAQVYWAKGHYWLKDLQTENGTRLRGVRIGDTPIQSGDEISIASHSFLFFDKENDKQRYYLVFCGGERGGEEIVLDRLPETIGRHPSCLLRLDDKDVSSRHTMIYEENGKLLIKDLDSTNGTFVNKNKISGEITLEHGDEIRIGTHLFVFRNSLKPRPKILQEEKFVLLPVLGKKYGKPLLLQPRYTIGRSPENDLNLSNNLVSRQHAVILHEKNHYYIRDMKSRSGTWVNGQRVMNARLYHGDEIRIGKKFLIFKNGLKPLKQGVMGIPSWLYAMAAAMVLFFIVSMFLLLQTPEGKEQVEDKKQKQVKKVVDDKKILQVFSEKSRQLQKKYQYDKALELLEKYNKKVSSVASQQYLEEEREKIQKHYKFFQEIVQQAQINSEREFIYLEFRKRGQCLIQSVGEEELKFKESLSGKVFILEWRKLPQANTFELLDKIGLKQENPYEIALFAFIHADKETAGRYLVEAFQKAQLAEKYGQKQSIAQLYAETMEIPLPKKGFVVYRDRLVSPERKEKLEKSLARKTREREERLAKELSRRKSEYNAKKALEREREEFPLRMAMTEEFVRTYDYHSAIIQLQNLEKELQSSDLKKRVRSRIRGIEPMDQLFKKTIKTINQKKLINAQISFGRVKGKLEKADNKQFYVKIGRGFMVYPWYALPPAQFYQVLSKNQLTTRELFLTGMFCFEHNLLDEGNRCFIQLIKRSPEIKPGVDRYLSDKLGIPIPEGGFTPYRGKLVSKNEKEMRLKGLVRYKDKWVTSQDKKKLEQGYIRYKGKWVTVDEKNMRDKGYSKYLGKWYSAKELEKLRSNWEHAWAAETKHYHIKTNISGKFIEELSQFMECAHSEYETFFEKKIDTKPTIYAFRTYEDYRKYCTDTNQTSQLRAGGFASSRTNTGVGWMRNNTKELMKTMIHEGAHLYQFNAYKTFRAPSWFAEAIATQFEGYKWNGKKLQMDFVSPRLPWLQRVIPEESYIPISELVQGEALQHINTSPQSAGTFYSECWGLYHFLWRSPKYQKRFKAFRKEMFEGKYSGRESEAFLKEFSRDLSKIEDAWHKFILSMN